MSISASIVLDSLSASNVRLTTLALRYPRYIHPQFMTHRLFSRSASSNRAIPTKKIIQDIRDDPALPTFWGQLKPGMQADVEAANAGELEEEYRNTMEFVLRSAERLSNAGLHKQNVNRLLEPFMHIDVLVTATDWDNFFNLRLSQDAQHEICDVAHAIKTAMEASEPQKVARGNYHLPFLFQEEQDALHQSLQIAVSSARCARISYKLFGRDIVSTPEEDIRLYGHLRKSGHYSPLEHVAESLDKPTRHANLRGWISHRTSLEQVGM